MGIWLRALVINNALSHQKNLPQLSNYGESEKFWINIDVVIKNAQHALRKRIK